MAEQSSSHPGDLGGGDIPASETSIREFWEEKRIFPRSERERSDRKPFVFYEGPPTANGMPGVHHVISRLVKDIFCRYRTMQGDWVLRKAGWDTHGLPVEIEVEKQLGLKNKDEVEAYGIAEFNAQCRESVFKYKQQWDEFTGRIGFWLNLDEPYVTYENDYVESVWWVLKQLDQKGLLYKGFKVVPYCTRCETALSSHEVAQGYQDVDDPSVTVIFSAENGDEHFLVWTTTPWTLPSNVGLAVGEEIEYARVRHEGKTFIIAEERRSSYFGEDAELLGHVKGKELVGRRYQQLIPILEPEGGDAFRVVAADFVSTSDGTGIVHMAPAYGEDDNRIARAEGLAVLHPVDRSGRFVDALTPYAGQHVKEADKQIARDLKVAGKMFRHETLRHSYPHCWRCKSPLLYYARDSWYVETTQVREDLIAANKAVNWVPGGVGQERFGDWLENNVDWALSRDRFWGTPLPIWECSGCDHRHCIGSREELKELAGQLPEDLHRPFVDEIEFPCPSCKSAMRRTPEVIDVWFDSGAMPFAQWHYPFENSEIFDRQFPADFISEGMDQTRGWFYSLLAIATMVKGVSSYKNVVAIGLLLDRHGHKMSKSKGNAVDPMKILREEGADPLRWYLGIVSPAGQPTRFDVEGIREHRRRELATLENVYAFYALYSNVDGMHGNALPEGVELQDELDRWLYSRYHAVVAEVTAALDGWDNTLAARILADFIVDELSNWYVRRSRRRFWKGEVGAAKQQAYDTLWTVLEGLSRLLAPFTPFLGERLYRALHAPRLNDPAFEPLESVHLAAWPQSRDADRHPELELRMAGVLQLVSLGRSLRMQHDLKIRQPLREALVHSVRTGMKEAATEPSARALVLDELNIKELRWLDDPGRVSKVSAKANFRAIGKRFGKETPLVAKAIAALDPDSLRKLRSEGTLEVEAAGKMCEVHAEEIFFTEEGLEGYVSSSGDGTLLALDTALDEELRQEGLARELVNRIQKLRKESGLEVDDRIHLAVHGLDAVLAAHGKSVQEETLAVALGDLGASPLGEVTFELDGNEVSIALKRADQPD